MYKPAFLEDKDWLWEHPGTPETRAELGFDYIASRLEYDISPTELEYFARVVEAESNRASYMSEGKIAIAVCIWDRALSNNWPDTISGVLSQPGQFSTTSGGWCNTGWTESSLAAIIEAWDRIVSGIAPTNLIYFNCIGYNGHTAYDYIGGNYFMTTGQAQYVNWDE